jgi:hypothetical protein
VAGVDKHCPCGWEDVLLEDTEYPNDILNPIHGVDVCFAPQTDFSSTAGGVES